MNPPLREPEDREALRQGLRDGTIDVICTDHAPHHYDEKEREFDDAPNGIIGLETALGLAVTELVETGLLIALRDLVNRMSVMPARIFNLPGGTLAPGSPGGRRDLRSRDALGRCARRTSTPRAATRRSRAGGSRAGRRSPIVRGQVVFGREGSPVDGE